jgi:hypothetical protein
LCLENFYYSKYLIKAESDYDHASEVDARTIDDMSDVSDVADNFDQPRDMEPNISTHTKENQPTPSVQNYV